MRKWLALPIIALIVSFSTNSQAGVLFDNGGPNQTGGLIVVGNGGNNTLGAIFDDFVMTQPSVIDGAEFWTIENQTDGIWNGQINFFIVQDDGLGNPDLLSGVKVAGLATMVSKTATGNVVATSGGPADEYHYVVDLPTPPGTFTPIVGVKYWLGLYLGQSSNELFWEFTGTNATDTAKAFVPDPTGATLGTFLNSPVHAAFQLTGTRIPNPAPLALIGLGILAMGVRRKK